MFSMGGSKLQRRKEKEKNELIKYLKENDPLNFLLSISKELDYPNNPTNLAFHKNNNPSLEDFRNAINAYARSVSVEWNKEKKISEKEKGFLATNSTCFSAGAPLNPLAEYCAQDRNGNYNLKDLARLGQEDLSKIVTNLTNSYTTYQKFSRNLFDKAMDGTMLKESGIIQAGKAGIALTGFIVYASLVTAEVATRASLFTALAISYSAIRLVETITHKLFKNQTFFKNLTAQFAKDGESAYAETRPGFIEKFSNTLTKKTLYSLPIAEKFINHPLDTLNSLIVYGRGFFSKILKSVGDQYSKHLGQKLREPVGQLRKSSSPMRALPIEPDQKVESKRITSPKTSEFLAEASSRNFSKYSDLNDLYSSIDRLTEEKFIEFMQKHYPNDHMQFLKEKKVFEGLEDKEKTTRPRNLKFDQLDKIIAENYTKDVLLNLKIYEESKELEALISEERFGKEDLLNFMKKHYPEEHQENELKWREENKNELSTEIIKIIYCEENFENTVKYFKELKLDEEFKESLKNYIKLLEHDEMNKFKIGDLVTLNKQFKVLQIPFSDKEGGEATYKNDYVRLYQKNRLSALSALEHLSSFYSSIKESEKEKTRKDLLPIFKLLEKIKPLNGWQEAATPAAEAPQAPAPTAEASPPLPASPPPAETSPPPTPPPPPPPPQPPAEASPPPPPAPIPVEAPPPHAPVAEVQPPPLTPPTTLVHAPKLPAWVMNKSNPSPTPSDPENRGPLSSTISQNPTPQ